MNLVIRRALKNDAIRNFYNVEAEEVLADHKKQQQLFYRIFPDKVVGRKKRLLTFEWMVSRIEDGLKSKAPRELIHLISSARDVQLRKLENGDPEPPNGLLMDRTAIKEALIPVSKTRLEQTIFAEYSQFREKLLKLQNEKTQQTAETLARIWGVETEEAARVGNELVEVGFFVKRERKGITEYWVPFLYRDSLGMSQGVAYSTPGITPDEDEYDGDDFEEDEV